MYRLERKFQDDDATIVGATALHRDTARKASEKVTKTALLASHRELARAIEQEERE